MTVIYAAVGPSGTMGTIAPDFFSFADYSANSAADAVALSANPDAHPAIAGVTLFKGADMGLNANPANSDSYQTRAVNADARIVVGAINILTVQASSAVNSDQDLTDLGIYCAARREAGWYVIVPTMQANANATQNTNRARWNPIIRAWLGVYCDAMADWAANSIIGPDAAGNDNSLFYDGQHATTLCDSIKAEILRPILVTRIASGKVRRLVKIGS